MAGFDPGPLKGLPRKPKEVWQGGLVRIPAWVDEPGRRPFMPWGAVWVSVGPRLVHSGETVPPAERSPGQALAAFTAFALDPTIGGYLPGRVEVADAGVAEALREALGPLGIEVVERGRLAVLERTVGELAEGLNERPAFPDALSPLGATVERLTSFIEAARLFHEAAPWRHLSSEDLIRIEAPRGPVEQSHALVFGAGGGDKALILFESAALHERLLGPDSGPHVLDDEGHDAVLFATITDMPIEDAVLFEDHNLDVAGPAAYPWAVRFRPKGRIDRLSPRALAHAEAVLRALAATTEAEIDSGRWTRLVPAPDGPVAVRLALPALLDERFIGRTPDEIPSTAATPLEKAQDLCYEAFEALGRRRIVLARRALALSADCADAWSILAEESADPAEAMRCYREAAAAAERALGSDCFASDTPFWADVRTRPFMRAVEGLAEVSASQGLVADAIAHYQRLLRLNPNDNQGVRDPLAGLLLAAGEHAAVEKLVDAYDSDFEPTLLHARALNLFQQEGETAASRKALRRAHKANRHVAEILLGRAAPDPLPPHYTLGSIEEARCVVSAVGKPWRETAGALDWLGEQIGAGGPAAPKGRSRRRAGRMG